jgi:hypothetical protein
LNTVHDYSRSDVAALGTVGLGFHGERHFFPGAAADFGVALNLIHVPLGSATPLRPIEWHYDSLVRGALGNEVASVVVPFGPARLLDGLCITIRGEESMYAFMPKEHGAKVPLRPGQAVVFGDLFRALELTASVDSPGDVSFAVGFVHDRRLPVADGMVNRLVK